MNKLIQSKLELLPTSPGCYIHKDKNGTIIYVGKAKNLRNRVRSYFRGSHDTKTEALVSEIEDFEFIVTESNIEALLLEINLIKENKPKYNIMLKDDKSYPFIKITNESYPRLIITRQVKKDGGLYFGPYPDVGAANEIKRLLDRLFPFRKCTNPPEKVCFYYHLGQCKAHTICHVDSQYFKELAQEVAAFLKGQDDQIIEDLRGKMAGAAQAMEFEKAAEYRDLIQSIGTLRTKQRVMAKDLQNRDVFGYYVDKGWMCVQVFFVRQGKLIERDVNLFPYYNDPDEDFLTYIGQFYQEKSHLKPNEILIPADIDEEAVRAMVDTKVLKPQRGEKKQLVNLATKNARVSLQQKFDLLEKSIEKTQGAIENLGQLLNIPTPVRIESFDNSNIMGTSPVSAMVVFVNGKPSKKDYRKYKIKTVVGPDDYASMREVIKRRYSRVIRDGLTPPDLIVIDGGQGQVNVAKEVIQEQLGLDIPIAGLQKNDKHQTHELLFGDPLQVVELSRNSQEFFLLQRIQDEVHRFAITFHRQLRSKNSFSSQLDGIEGLGPKRKQNLMKHFKSLTKIKEASVDQIVEVGVPRAVAEAVWEKLNPKNQDQEQVQLREVAEPVLDIDWKISLSDFRESYKINLNESFAKIGKIITIIMELSLGMDNHQLQKISDILYAESNAKAVSYIKSLQTEDELFVLLDNFNWDNGFEVPQAVIEHSKCTLSIALLAFYRADGIRYLLDAEAAFVNSSSKEWEEFVKDVYDRIIRRTFPDGNISFRPEITRIQKFKLKKLKPALNPIFIDGVSGKDLNIVI